jgi:hypothetical protein
MWRISDDFWDHWGPWPGHEWSQGLLGQFATAATWADFSVPGHWPDADMLPLGHLGPHAGEGETRDTRFTRDEQRTLVTAWAIFRSPLIMGGDLLSCDEWTESLLTDPEVLAVNQHSLDNRPVMTTKEAVVWLAQTEDRASHYLAVFNISDSEQTISYQWQDFGLHGKRYQVRDLWDQKDLGTAALFNVKLLPHASVLYRLVAAH